MSIITVGIDLAKNVFAVHGVDDIGKPVPSSIGIDGGTKPWNPPIESKPPCSQHQIERQSDKVELVVRILKGELDEEVAKRCHSFLKDAIGVGAC